MSEQEAWSGIDVAKAWLDVATSDEPVRRVANDVAGIATLVAQLTAQRPRLIVLEATGDMRRR